MSLGRVLLPDRTKGEATIVGPPNERAEVWLPVDMQRARYSALFFPSGDNPVMLKSWNRSPCRTIMTIKSEKLAEEFEELGDDEDDGWRDRLRASAVKSRCRMVM